MLPVIGHATGADGVAWLRVRLPGRPNGLTGWIAKRATLPGATSWHLVVSTGLRRVTVYRAGRPVRAFTAIVGKPSTPTPRGEVFVEESVRLSATDVGAPFALAVPRGAVVLHVGRALSPTQAAPGRERYVVPTVSAVRAFLRELVDGISGPAVAA